MPFHGEGAEGFRQTLSVIFADSLGLYLKYLRSMDLDGVCVVSTAPKYTVLLYEHILYHSHVYTSTVSGERRHNDMPA